MINITITCPFFFLVGFILYVISIAIGSGDVGYNSAGFFCSLLLGHGTPAGAFFPSNVRFFSR